MARSQQDYFAKTLEKGMRVLCLFDQDKPSWSLSEIAKRLQINLTSVYRLVNTLVELGYLEKGKQSKTIRLGPMSVALGNQWLHGYDPIRLIKPLVDEYHYRYDISIDVSMFHSSYLVQIYSRETEDTLTYHQENVSEKLYCTGTGKAVLAFLSPAETERIIHLQSFTRRTEKTITDVEIFRDELKSIRQRGYALNNEENIKGLIAIAAPILGRTNRLPLGAVSFTTTTLEQNMEQFHEKYAYALSELSKKLSEIIPDF